MADPGIVRNRAKIVSTLNNARRACELVAESGSLAKWLWSFEPTPDERPGAGGSGVLERQPDVTGFGALVEGLEETRVDLRGADHDVCVDAGDGDGQ